VREYAEDLIRNMADKPVCDFVEEFTFPLPAFAGFSLLGFPREDADMIRDWCGERVALTYGRPDPEGQLRGAHDLVAFWDYCAKFIESRQKQPQDDLTSDLLALSERRGDLLAIDDIRNMVYAISLAAHDTTTTAITNGLKHLLLRRESWEEIKADPTLIPNAVEELMRFDGPMVGHRRKALKAGEIGGCPIPEGAVIVMLIGSANHDERKFGASEEIDIRREDASDHFAFGNGFHHCLGSPLARWEFGLALELLTQRLPDMRLVEDQAFEYKPLAAFRSLSRLLIEPRGRSDVEPRQAARAVRQLA
jgi:cytochrome P450